MTVFFERLLTLKSKHNMTQKDLCDAIKITPATYRQYEQGAKWPDLPVILRIADWFGVSADWLMGRTNKSHEFVGGTVQELVRVSSFTKAAMLVQVSGRVHKGEWVYIQGVKGTDIESGPAICIEDSVTVPERLMRALGISTAVKAEKKMEFCPISPTNELVNEESTNCAVGESGGSETDE